MNTKNKFLLFFIVLFALLFFLLFPCHGKLICNGPTANTFLQYPFFWSFCLIPLSLLALTLKDIKYKFWLGFTGTFFPMSMFVVFLLPEYGSGIVSLDRELGNWFFLGIYSLISIIYFIFQFLKRNQKES